MSEPAAALNFKVTSKFSLSAVFSLPLLFEISGGFQHKLITDKLEIC
jgi:hypothetical protein